MAAVQVTSFVASKENSIEINQRGNTIINTRASSHLQLPRYQCDLNDASPLRSVSKQTCKATTSVDINNKSVQYADQYDDVNAEGRICAQFDFHDQSETSQANHTHGKDRRA